VLLINAFVIFVDDTQRQWGSPVEFPQNLKSFLVFIIVDGPLIPGLLMSLPVEVDIGSKREHHHDSPLPDC
jgi:hypothetical protein